VTTVHTFMISHQCSRGVCVRNVEMLWSDASAIDSLNEEENARLIWTGANMFIDVLHGGIQHHVSVSRSKAQSVGKEKYK